MLRLIDSEHEISCDRCSFINPLDTRTSSFMPITTQRKLKNIKTIQIYKLLHTKYARPLVKNPDCANSTQQRLVNQSNGSGHRFV